MNAQIEQILDQRAAKLTQILQAELSQPGRGRLYGSHRASAPGDPPAADTGRLRREIDTAAQPGHRRITIKAPYAYDLEFGARTVAPRPFARPAIIKFRRSPR